MNIQKSDLTTKKIEKPSSNLNMQIFRKDCINVMKQKFFILKYFKCD